MAKLRMTWCLKRAFFLTNRWSSRLLHCTSSPKSSAFHADENFPATRADEDDPIVRHSNVDMEAPRDLEQFEEDAKSGRTIAIKTLMKIFGTTRENATRALQEFPTLAARDKKTLYHNFHILRENGMSIVKDEHQFLLTFKVSELEEKLRLIKSVNPNIQDATPLFRLNIQVLRKFAKEAKFDSSYLPRRNRFAYLADRFECDVEKICNSVSYNPFLLTVGSAKLVALTELMLDMGIDSQYILNDMNCYRCSLHRLQVGIGEAKAIGMSPLKPWVARCPPRLWKMTKAKFAAQKPLLDTGLSREEHLCRIFECDMELAKYFIMKVPVLRTMGLVKFVTNARIFRDEGFTIQRIMRAPMIFVKSSDTLRKRFAEWNAVSDTKSHYIYVFGKTNMMFEKFISEAREAQNKKP